MKAIHLVLAMMVSMLGACGGEDYGEGLCEAQVSRPDACDFTSPCSTAIGAANAPGGACADELQVVIATSTASYEACSAACPAQRTCDVGGTTINYRSCSCQTACIREATPEYRDAVAAYTNCLETQASITSSCY
jgi:hypothetical protein